VCHAAMRAALTFAWSRGLLGAYPSSYTSMYRTGMHLVAEVLLQGPAEPVSDSAQEGLLPCHLLQHPTCVHLGQSTHQTHLPSGSSSASQSSMEAECPREPQHGAQPHQRTSMSELLPVAEAEQAGRLQLHDGVNTAPTCCNALPLQMRLLPLLLTRALLLAGGLERARMFHLTGLKWGIHAVAPHVCVLAMGLVMDLRRRTTFLTTQPAPRATPQPDVTPPRGRLLNKKAV
jgi:hypothetical protein